MHAPGGQSRANLLPQDRRDLVAVEAVEDTPRLLRLDEILVDLARVLDRVFDGGRCDLVEDHAFDGDLGVEHFAEVPGDGLALAVLVRGEVELVSALQQLLEFGDLLLLRGRHDVEWLEIVIDIDAETRPRLPLVLLRYLGCLRGQVADVAD